MGSGAVEKEGNDAAGESWVEGTYLVEEVATGAMAHCAEKSVSQVFRVVGGVDLTFALTLLKDGCHEIKNPAAAKGVNCAGGDFIRCSKSCGKNKPGEVLVLSREMEQGGSGGNEFIFAGALFRDRGFNKRKIFFKSVVDDRFEKAGFALEIIIECGF